MNTHQVMAGPASAAFSPNPAILTKANRLDDYAWGQMRVLRTYYHTTRRLVFSSVHLIATEADLPVR